MAKNNFHKFEIDLGNKSIAKLKQELKKYPNNSNERELTLDIISGIEKEIRKLESIIKPYLT